MIAVRHDDSSEESQLHTSPDGQLALSVLSDSSGEIIISFHGFEWEVEGSHLAETSGQSLPEASRKFVRSILDDESIIAVLSVDGDVTDVWITEHPQSDLEQCTDDEELVFRFWSGKPYAPE